MLRQVKEALELARKGRLSQAEACRVLGQMSDYLTQTEEENLKERHHRAITAVSGFTVSEATAAEAVMTEMGSATGAVIVAARISDRCGVNRSTCNAAIRRLAAAGLIRYQSLGAKGTRVDLLDGWSPLEILALVRHRGKGGPGV
jgi:GTP-sensing pleiotropic transcriptional regulator CodY